MAAHQRHSGARGGHLTKIAVDSRSIVRALRALYLMRLQLNLGR